MVENFFYSIEIRDLNFEYDRYYLSLEEDPNDFLFIENSKVNNELLNKNLSKKIISDITPYTIVPKFSIDKINTPILFQIFNIDYNSLQKKEENEINSEIENNDEKNSINEKDDEDNNDINNEFAKKNLTKEKLYLKSKNMIEITLHLKSYTTNNIIFSFPIRYPLFPDFYTYLGEKPDQFKILQFPCILLQYESGSIITNVNQPKKKSKKSKSDNLNENKNDTELNSGYYALKKIIISKKEDKFYDEEINFAIKKNVMEHIFINRQKPMKEKEKNYIVLQNILMIKGTYDSTLLALEEKKRN